MLALSQGTLYYNTNLGAVAALRPRDGTVKWIACYPATPAADDPDRDDRYLFRDSNPCLVDRDMVFAAPADSDRLFAMDAAGGDLIWAGQPGRVAGVLHLLGVGADNLIASGDHLIWLEAYSGRCVGQFPQPILHAHGQAPPSPRGYGRGLLAGNRVYWPTREEICVFEQQTRKTPEGWSPVGVRRIDLTHRGATGGNLVMADDVLLIASADRLYAFNEYGRRATSGARRRARDDSQEASDDGEPPGVAGLPARPRVAPRPQEKLAHARR
jgi:outer membrane protein assembly factor BamB